VSVVAPRAAPRTRRLRKVGRVASVRGGGYKGAQVGRGRCSWGVRRCGAADAEVEAVKDPLRLHQRAAGERGQGVRGGGGAVHNLMRHAVVLLAEGAAGAFPAHAPTRSADDEGERVAAGLAAQEEDEATEEATTPLPLPAAAALRRVQRSQRRVQLGVSSRIRLSAAVRSSRQHGGRAARLQPCVQPGRVRQPQRVVQAVVDEAQQRLPFGKKGRGAVQ